MKFLITTSKGFGLLDNGKMTMIHETDDKRMFGITWDRDNIYVSKNLPDHSTIMVFDKNFKFIRDFSNGKNMQDVHQIFYSRTNKLYVCNTKNDRIDVWDGKRWSDFTWRERSSKHHFNTVWEEADGTLYFIEHNRHFTPIRRSRVYMLDRNHKIKDSFQIGRGAHNVFVDGAKMYINSSCDFTFLMYSKQSKEVMLERDMPDEHIFSYDYWHTRGLCFDGNTFYIGLSEYLPRDRQNFALKAAIAMVDKNLKYKSHIEVPDVGQIYDMRLLDAPDLAHNGIPF